MAKTWRPRDRGKAIYRVREVRSPIHHEFRGLRVEVATPNMSGVKPFSDKPCPSFDKPYFVCYFGSYESWEYLERKWPSIWRAIKAMGFTSVQQMQLTPEEQEAVVAVEDETVGLPASNQPSPQEDQNSNQNNTAHSTKQEDTNKGE